MRENLTYGLMWQGVETASFDARRHLLTLPADGGGELGENVSTRSPQLKRKPIARQTTGAWLGGDPAVVICGAARR